MLTLERSVKIIQVSERARQGRLRAKFMIEIYKDSRRKAKENGAITRDQAAVTIQKVPFFYNAKLFLTILYHLKS